jgi:hypothetical protein
MHARTSVRPPAGNAVQVANRDNLKHTQHGNPKTPNPKPPKLQFAISCFCFNKCFDEVVFANLAEPFFPKLLDGISFVFNMRLESLVHIC